MKDSDLDEGLSTADRTAQLRPALVRFFRRGASYVEAEDLAHDVLLRCLGHHLEGTPAEIQGYVFRAARNRWHDRRRRMATHGTAVAWDDEAYDHPHEESTPESAAATEQELKSVALRLEALEVRVRLIILWVKVGNMRIDVVARRLGVSRSTVNKCLAYGLAQLRQDRLLRSRVRAARGACMTSPT